MQQDPYIENAEDTAADEHLLNEKSLPFVGRWNRLVSNTNWEKGRIIFQWREELVAAGAAATEYSDDAWSRRVGGVTGQHVGRLRRVYQRFSQDYQQFKGLYWSHFQAAIDWDDAEMWLEGAVQNEWSVSHMRRQRWETLGAIDGQEPDEQDVVVSETDEDFEAATDEAAPAQRVRDQLHDVKSDSLDEGADFGDADDPDGHRPPPLQGDGASIYADEQNEPTVDFVQPFANLADLPNDLAEAFEAFKLAILRHKLEGWQQISREDVLGSLEALKELALAPSADNAPF